MMTVCLPCHLAIRVLEWTDEAESLIGKDSEFYPAHYPCPACARKCRLLQESEVDPQSLQNLKLVDLTAQEAFIAFSGVGLPSERSFDAELIEKLLKETPIRKVCGGMVGNCYVLDHMELWDGTRLFLAASPEGGVIYRVAPPTSYAESSKDV